MSKVWGERSDPGPCPPRTRARLLRGRGWFVLPGPTYAQCGGCYRRLEPGEAVVYVWGRTAADAALWAWCCEEKWKERTKVLPSPAQAAPAPPPAPGRPAPRRGGSAFFG